MRKLRGTHLLPDLGGAEEGTTAVEWAVILIPLLLLLVGMIEFAAAYWTWNTMLLAVGEGARYAMVYNKYASWNCNGSLEQNTVAVVQNNLIGFTDTSGFTISACSQNGSTPPTMTISASYNFDFVAAGLLPYGPITLTSQVTVPLI